MTKEECKGIWVFAEQENGVLSGTDFELLAKAHDLKAKLGQVIVMILVVKFFEKALAFQPKEALDFFLFAGGVALLAGALWVSARE